MRAQCRLLPAIILSLIAAPLIASAQHKDVSVAYLRAALSTIPDRGSVVLRATYLPDPGLIEPQGRGARGGGFCRFSVKDPKTGTVFGSMYCAQDSAAFKGLIAVTKPTAFYFRGYKDYGEANAPGIFVESVEPSTEPSSEPTDVAPQASPEVRFRVTITDNVTSNRTILADVAMERAYSVGAVTLSIEREPPSRIGGIGLETERERGSLPKGPDSGGY